eukprot:3254431-Rhodomonas_salina.2
MGPGLKHALRTAGHSVLGFGRPATGGVDVRTVVSARAQVRVCVRGVDFKSLRHTVPTEHTPAAPVSTKRRDVFFERGAETAASRCDGKGFDGSVRAHVVGHTAWEVGRLKSAQDAVVVVVVVVTQRVAPDGVREIEGVERRPWHRVARPCCVHDIDCPAPSLRAGWLELHSHDLHP